MNRQTMVDLEEEVTKIREHLREKIKMIRLTALDWEEEDIKIR